jgi:hypothetical protein
LAPCRQQDRVLIEIIAVEMLVDLPEHRIGFQERRHRAVRGLHRKAHIDGIAEVAGVAQIVAGRES